MLGDLLHLGIRGISRGASLLVHPTGATDKRQHHRNVLHLHGTKTSSNPDRPHDRRHEYGAKSENWSPAVYEKTASQVVTTLALMECNYTPYIELVPGRDATKKLTCLTHIVNDAGPKARIEARRSEITVFH
jgi:hypothetical protein